ncbi:MAG: hypothetical protein SV062_03980 [Thermodesulfobacteriota bacterium]|nr:hypothetical protein [Thermodesulfobacteriota bacterium]
MEGKIELISLVTAIISVFFWIYMVKYQPVISYTNKLNKVNREFSGKIEKAEALKSKERAKETLFEIKDITQFLKKINRQAIDSGINFNSINPDPKDKSTYRVEIHSGFANLLKLLRHLEKSGLTIDDIAIRPYSNTESKISFSITDTGEKASGEDRATSEKSEFLAGTNQLRDPFRSWSEGYGPAYINLTWEHKLTGISIGKIRRATIDHCYYTIGDELGGKVITKITSNKVYLKKGDREYTITFRK